MVKVDYTEINRRGTWKALHFSTDDSKTISLETNRFVEMLFYKAATRTMNAMALFLLIFYFFQTCFLLFFFLELANHSLDSKHSANTFFPRVFLC